MYHRVPDHGDPLQTKYYLRLSLGRLANKTSKTASAKTSGFFQACTNTNFKLVVVVDGIPDLDDCPKMFECGKPLLPDWAIADVPS